jgi:AMMECR1 domain-containing protein/orotate phosphoribosyltransferase
MLRDALSKTLATLPESFHSGRTELLELMRQHGILYRTPDQPVLSRDGTSARWMLDSLAVTLSPKGGQLAGSCMLELLKRFDGRQIATYGLTAVPILQSCLLQDNRYRGLLVRKERKSHGSLKLIEGSIDYSEPVILLDDSVSSGLSMEEATERLEQAGLRVEGGICLVRFGWYGGYARMQERGYHMEAVYDIWDDFMSQMKDEELPLRNPSKWFPEFRWSSERAPEGLHPTELARRVVSKYLSSGELLQPPKRLDTDYDSSGGAWVSIRSRADIHQRYARDGYWHFPDEPRTSAADDVVMASLRTATELPSGEAGIELITQSGFAVTFFGALERCGPGRLDNDRYGIVVRSLERSGRVGGALPRMPGIRGEWEQFQHARIKNAQLVSFEPYELFRHEVRKVVEPEIVWQPTGVPAPKELSWQQDKTICGQLANRAREIVLTKLFKRPETSATFDDSLIPEALDSIYLTIYINGQLRGCMGSAVNALNADLERSAEAALEDARFAEVAAIDENSVAVSVSLLFNPLELGEVPLEEVGRYYRHGQQTLMAYRDGHVGLLLPFVAATNNLDSPDFVQAVIDKAGLLEPPYYWMRFDCVTWLAESRGVWPIVGGFPSIDCRASPLSELVARHSALAKQFLLRHLQEDGTFYSSYLPFQNRLYQQVDPARLAHGAWVLARCHKISGDSEAQSAAEKIVDYLLRDVNQNEEQIWLKTGDENPSTSELAFLALALANLRHSERPASLRKALSATLWSCIDLPHGRIATHRHPDPSLEPFQDYTPGQVLLALGTISEAGDNGIDEAKLHKAFRFYRHRFRYQRHFGQVSWLLQAFAKWWQVTQQRCFADMTFEIADWLLTYQQDKTGAFINDHQPETPGYTTAVYLEGLAAAAHVARELDERRYQSYCESFARAVAFLDRLIIQDRDRIILPNPEWALGGLRQGLYYSEVRIDFVQHALSAMLEFTPHLRDRNFQFVNSTGDFGNDRIQERV